MQYFDRTGRALSRREAFEEDGKTIRDGVSLRVHMSATDSAPRFADGRSFWDAHRDSLLVVDPRRVGGESGSRPGWRVSDSPINQRAVADARAAYLHDLQNAWRNPRDELTSAFHNPQAATFGAYPYSPQDEGRACTINGAPGILTRQGDWLVCKPVGELSKVSVFQPVGTDAAPPDDDPEEGDEDADEDDEDEEDEPQGKQQVRPVTADRRTINDVHAVSAAHQLAMGRIYDAAARELSEAWRKR